MVPFPESFKEILAMHVKDMKHNGAMHLFESSWKKLYTDRGIRKILQRYAIAAGLDKTISPHKLRHFLFTWLKKQGLDDAMIQPYSGHASRQSLEIYSRLSLAVAQEEYNQAIRKFPVRACLTCQFAPGCSFARFTPFRTESTLVVKTNPLKPNHW